MPDFLSIQDKTAVVGIGQTALAKGLEDTELSLACQAISLAIDDAGLSPADVDGLAMFSMEDGREVDVARNVGLGDITYFSQVGFGGGAGCGVVGQATPRGCALGGGGAGPASARRRRAARGPRCPTGSPATSSGAARSACSGRWTRSRS